MISDNYTANYTAKQENPENVLGEDAQFKQCQDLIQRSAFVLSQCKVVQQLTEKLSNSLKTNSNEIEASTKSIVHNLEYKISAKVETDLSAEEQSQKINMFCSEAFYSIKECADVLQQYETLLTDLGNIKMPEFKVTREAFFRAEPLVLNPELKNFTDFVINPTLSNGLYQFYDKDNCSTEFVKISTSGDQIEAISSFPVLFSHCTQHQNRLICDNYVYSLPDFKQIQTLEFANISSGCSLTPKLACLGHNANALLSLIAWTGTQYTMIQKNSILAANARQRAMSFSEIRKDAFSKLPNQIWIKQENREDRAISPALYRVLIDPKNLAESFKIQVRLSKDEPLLEFRQTSEEIVVTMQTSVATLSRIDDKCNAYTVSVVSFQSIPKGMVLMPGFEPEVLPLAVSMGRNGQYELGDIRGKGWLGKIVGLDDVEVIGQAPDQPNWVFIKSAKTGALGILKMYTC